MDPMADVKTVVVVIPARNEAPIISAVLSHVPSTIRTFKVVPLVIDDGSDDDTMTQRRAGWRLSCAISRISV